MRSASEPFPLSNLVALPDDVLWTSRAWTDFAQLPAAKKTVVVLPLFGFADWGLGRPLDVEEIVGSAVLRAALAERAARRLPLLVLPPLRWVLGPYPHTLFGVDFETACELLGEIGIAVKAAGFRKVVLFNTSPWNEELADVVGRDLRVDPGLQTFCVNLAALDLDLHPVRSKTRTSIQCIATALTGEMPAGEPITENIVARDFRPGNIRQPGPLRFTMAREQAAARGQKLLASAGERLAALLAEICERRPLARDGVIPVMRPPGTKRRRQSASKTRGRTRSRNRSRK